MKLWPRGPWQGGRRQGLPTLAYVFNQRIYRVGSRYYVMTPNILDLMLALCRCTGRVVVCAPTGVAEAQPPESELIPAELEVCELPFYASNLDLVLRSPFLSVGLLRRVLGSVRDWDLVGGDAPSGFGLATVILAILAGKRGFFYIRGHHTRAIWAEHRHLTWQGVLILASYWPLDVVARLLTLVGVPTLVMGRELAERHSGPRVRVLRGYARPAVVGSEPADPVDSSAQLQQLGYVGRLAPEKGVDILLRALHILINEGSQFTLTVAGSGPEDRRLETLTRDLGLQERVSFLGNIVDPDRLRALVLSRGIVVVPSLTEGVPVAMLEAMALGRAVVASSVGGIPTVVDDGRTGILVEPEDPRSLADGILRLAREPELAFRLAADAAREAQALTLDAQAAAMIDAVWGSPQPDPTQCHTH